MYESKINNEFVKCLYCISMFILDCLLQSNETFIYWNRLRLTGPTVIEPRALLNPETYLHAQFHVNPCKLKGEV